MQVFEQKKFKQKVHILCIYSKRRVFPFWGIHPMVILWSSYGDPMVWDLYGTEKSEEQGAEG